MSLKLLYFLKCCSFPFSPPFLVKSFQHVISEKVSAEDYKKKKGLDHIHSYKDS